MDPVMSTALITMAIFYVSYKIGYSHRDYHDAAIMGHMIDSLLADGYLHAVTDSDGVVNFVQIADIVRKNSVDTVTQVS